MTNQEKAVNKLIEKNYRIAFAESCTGGLCCGALVDVANASSVLDMSFVTYANDAKINLLGVSEKTINAFGVVSEEVAKEMAAGVSAKADSNVGVGITGIAGPTGGSDKKPVGTVCFGFCINGDIYTYTRHFGNIGRNAVRKKSVDFVYEILLSLI